MERVLLYVAAFAGFLLLVTLTFTLLKNAELENETLLKGSKNYVVARIAEKVYECHKKCENKRRSFICSRLRFESKESITGEDIAQAINPARIKKENVLAENLGKSGEIIIRCEKDKIFVEKIW